MMNTLSFRSKMLFTILPVILLGVLVIALGGYYSASQIIMNTQTADLTLLTKQIRNEMTEWMDDCRQEADLLGHLPEIRQAILGGDRRDAQSVLDEYHEHSPQYEAMWLADSKGTIFLDSIGGKAVGMDVAGLPDFMGNIAGAAEGKMVLSAVGRSPASGLPVVLLTAPVEQEGRLIGVVGLSINLDYFSKTFLAVIKIGERGYVWMTGRNGLILAHPDTGYILKLDISQYDFGKRILAEESGHLFYEWNGMDKIAFFDTDPETGWTVVASPVPDDLLRPLKELRVKLAGVGLAVLLAAGLVVCLIASILSKSIKKVVDVLDRMAEGDLSQRLGSGRKDEIGRMYQSLDATSERLATRVRLAQDISAGDISKDVKPASDRDHLGLALKTMVGSLREMLGAVSSAAEQISSESRQIAESSQALSQGASEQAASLEEITSSVVEIESQTRQNAGSASLARQEVQTVRTWAENGSGEMQALITAMGEIDGSARDVSAIIKTIDDIAFQTNLLALNAAVEAARAGKQGKGFAVVAGEVKNLAEKSAEAAKRTENLIRDVVLKVDTGTNAVDRTADALKAIVGGVAKVASLVEDISTASLDQSRGIEEISKGLALVEQVIHQNTSNAEQGAAAAEELSGQARELTELLEQFKLNGDGALTESSVFQAERIMYDARPDSLMSADITGLEEMDMLSEDDRDWLLPH